MSYANPNDPYYQYNQQQPQYDQPQAYNPYAPQPTDPQVQLDYGNVPQYATVITDANSGNKHYQITNASGGTIDISTSQPQSPVLAKQGSVRLDVNSKEVQDLLKIVGTSGYYEQAVKNFCYMASQFYAVMVGALLTVFVPQQCCTDYTITYPGPYGTDYETFPATDGVCTVETMSTAYLCSYTDEFTGLGTINEVALGWNFITLTVMLSYFYVLWQRENYVLKYFVEDPLSNEVHIRTQWGKYPELDSTMTMHSRNAFIACIVGIAFQVVNIILSGYVLFALYYAGSKTAIGFVSNILVQGGFVFLSAEICYADYKHHLSRTVLAKAPISYNRVNPKYRN